jgi:hypothetical protein
MSGKLPDWRNIQPEKRPRAMGPLAYAANGRTAGTVDHGTAGRYSRGHGHRHGHRHRTAEATETEATDPERAEGTEGTERAERTEAQAETASQTEAEAEATEAETKSAAAEGAEHRPCRHSNRKDSKNNEAVYYQFL